MKAQSFATLPLARTNEIVTKEIDGELLIYDTTRDKAHCLNSSAASIWKLCDGRTTIQEMAVSISRASEVAVDDTVIHCALKQLSAKSLLVEGTYIPIRSVDSPFVEIARCMNWN